MEQLCTSDRLNLSQQLIAALKEAQGQAAKPSSTSHVAGRAWLALQFDFPLVTAADLQLLASHLQASFQQDSRLPFNLHFKLLSNIQAGASSGKPLQAEYQAVAGLLFINLPAHMLEAPDEEALKLWMRWDERAMSDLSPALRILGSHISYPCFSDESLWKSNSAHPGDAGLHAWTVKALLAAFCHPQAASLGFLHDALLSLLHER
ncbi:hypothetical protein WJX74_002380 [Apatococcus lobatus]